MSTRGVIAVGTLENWKGRYHHFDSYPTGLGQSLFEHYHLTFNKNLKAMIGYLIKSQIASCGWSTVVNRDLSKPPISPEGRVSFSDPRYETQDNPICYWLRRDEKAYAKIEPTFTQDTSDHWCEWAYVIDPEKQVMHILHWQYGQWKHVTTVSLGSNEIDWQYIEQTAYGE